MAFFLYIFSSSGCTESRRYLCFDDWFDYSFGDNSIISIGSSCSSSIMLANGVQKATQGNWSFATSTRVP